MKKNISILIIIFFINSIQSQNNYSSPNVSNKNELSLFLKEQISKKELKKIIYPYGAQIIRVSFCLDKNNEIYNFKTTNKYKALNSVLELAFDNYPIEKLIGNTPDQSLKYSLQIISKQKSKNIFNCSNFITSEKNATIESCKKYKQYPDQKKCFSDALKNHFACTINSELLQKNNSNFITINYKISKAGVLYRKPNYKSKTKKFDQEVDRVLSLFKQNITPSYIDNTKLVATDKFVINLQDQSDIVCNIDQIGNPADQDNIYNPLNELIKSNFNKGSKPTIDNDFSIYIKDNISKNLLSKTNLNQINDQLILYFSIDSKNNLINIKTNARSKTVEKELISIIKQYPFEKLELPIDQHPYNTYIAQILSYENNNVTVKTSSKILYERLPVFRGCESYKNIIEGKKCFSNTITNHIMKSFNINLAKELSLTPGRKRIYCLFNIDKNGQIGSIKIRAPHEELKNEGIRVIKSLPELKKGAIQNGKPVSIKYMLPISFIVSAGTTNSNSNYDYKSTKTNYQPNRTTY